MSAGMVHLCCAVGLVWFEVEVLEATGDFRVGFAGTCFRGSELGGDATSWAVNMDGNARHGSLLLPSPQISTTASILTEDSAGYTARTRPPIPWLPYISVGQ